MKINNTYEWESPILFDNIETPNIPSDLLPEPLNEFVRSLSESTETPAEMAAMVVLSVVATSLQGKAIVKPRGEEDYSETLNIYSITSLPPANRKSSILNQCISPLVQWEKDQKELLELEISKQRSRYESEKRIIESKRKKLSSENSEKLINEIAEHEASLKEPDILPRLFVNDITPESLVSITCEQNGRMSILSDEGGIIDTLGGLYNGGNANIDILLKGWDAGYIRQKRKDSEVNFNPLLTINLTVQPVVIQNMGNKKSYAGKGLLERFLYCLPKSKLGYRTNDKAPVSKQVRQSYHNKIRELLDIPYEEQPVVLTLCPEAYQEWRSFQNAIEVDLRPDGRLSICQGWGGKICGYALRIAALFHIVEFGTSNTHIGKPSLDKALEICAILSHHAVFAFDNMLANPDLKDAKEILEWILSNNLKSFTKAELTKKMQNRNNMRAKRLELLLNILVERNLISEPGIVGKKTSLYITNPIILEGQSS
jgi:hypothetical protein